MNKQQRPSLEALAGAVAPTPDNVVPGPGAKPAKPAPLRRDKPHMSLYLDRRVQKVIKEIALAYDRRPHDLYIDAVNMLLRSYGKGTVADIAPPSPRDDVTTG
jgi:hypothetical protein